MKVPLSTKHTNLKKEEISFQFFKVSIIACVVKYNRRTDRRERPFSSKRLWNSETIKDIKG